jgi:NAD(P)-dependent dehydrogenase (short-subunit alcohol dehydrogenase family)
MATATGTIVVTGANGGLGSAIAESIASSPDYCTYHGIYTVRNSTAAPALDAALTRGKSNHPYEALSLDLTDLNNVRQAAQSINVSGILSKGVQPCSALPLLRTY